MKSKGNTPRSCPSCAGTNGLREVLYGLPEFPVNQDKYFIGGCCPDGPEWVCLTCNWGIDDSDDFQLGESSPATNGA